MSDGAQSTTKIAIMIGQLGRGGSERQLYAFLNYCDRDRWSPIVYVSGALGPWDAPIRDLGIPISLLQGKPVTKMWQFRELCRTNRVRRFFSWSAYTNGYGLALLGLDIPRIGSFRNICSPELFGRYGGLWLWMSLAAVSTVVCNSQETTAAVRSRVGNRKRVVYVPNSVRQVKNMTLCRATWRQRLQISESEILILGVGRLAPQKNFARFVEMVDLVSRKVPIRAVVAGKDAGCLESLRQQINASGIDSGVIEFIGPVPDARKLVCAADVFVLSSDYEGMPNVIMEALAAGVPCVSTEVNGVSALIEQGVNGFITDHRADTLAEKVLLLTRNRKLREEMGAKAAERINGAFAPEVIASRLWRLCE